MEGDEEEENVADPEQEVEEMEAASKMNYSNNPDQVDTLPFEVDSFWRIDPTMETGTPPDKKNGKKNSRG